MIYQEPLKGGIVRRNLCRHISESMLQIARSRFPGATFMSGDIVNLSFADRSQPKRALIQCGPTCRSTGRQSATDARRQPLPLHRRLVPTGDQDHLAFGRDLQTEKGPGFHLNRYSLPKFLRFVRDNSDKQIDGPPRQIADGTGALES